MLAYTYFVILADVFHISRQILTLSSNIGWRKGSLRPRSQVLKIEFFSFAYTAFIY
jgi:hypothetical protein